MYTDAPYNATVCIGRFHYRHARRTWSGVWGWKTRWTDINYVCVINLSVRSVGRNASHKFERNAHRVIVRVVRTYCFSCPSCEHTSFGGAKIWVTVDDVVVVRVKREIVDVKSMGNCKNSKTAVFFFFLILHYDYRLPHTTIFLLYSRSDKKNRQARGASCFWLQNVCVLA